MSEELPSLADEKVGLRKADDKALRTMLMVSAVTIAASMTLIAGYFTWKWYAVYRTVSVAEQFADDLRELGSGTYSEEIRYQKIRKIRPLRDRECHVKLVEHVNGNAGVLNYQLSAQGAWRKSDEGEVWDLQLQKELAVEWRPAKIVYDEPGECFVVDILSGKNLAQWNRKIEEDFLFKPADEPMYRVKHRQTEPEFVKVQDKEQWSIPLSEIEFERAQKIIAEERREIRAGRETEEEGKGGIAW